MAPPSGPTTSELKRGWTTGACATAAAKAAFQALVSGRFPDPVTIRLPGGETPSFALAQRELAPGRATAGVVKDAGDDPDVTHGALVLASVTPAAYACTPRFARVALSLFTPIPQQDLLH